MDHVYTTALWWGSYNPPEVVQVLGKPEDFGEEFSTLRGYTGWLVIQRQDGSRMCASEGNLEIQ